MPIYQYKGYDAKGKAVKGLKEADSTKTLRQILRREGILATELTETSGQILTKSSKSASNFLTQNVQIKALLEHVSSEQLGVSTRQLATLLQAGVPMVDALNALIDQIENEALRRIYSEIKADVNEGLALADAMEKHKVFSSIYINMVRAGESSGALELVLERLADFSESQAQLRSRVMGAMMYPAVMMAIGGIIMVVMLTSVVPKISKVFLHAKIQLPLMTRMLIGTSSFLSGYWWLCIIMAGGLVYLFLRYIKTPKGRDIWDKFRLRAPVFGPISQMVAVARFSRTLSTLLASGVPLLAALQIVRNVMANALLEKAVDDVRDAVREGEDIATPLKRSGCFPPMVTHMIAIGEKSGQLEAMLTRVAATYEQQVQIRVATLTGLLEPIMIVMMGGSVGFIVFAILTPIMQMSQLVK